MPLQPCPHGGILGACDTCDREYREALEALAADPVTALGPLRTWIANNADDLARLSRLTAYWPHLHTDLQVLAPVGPKVAAELEAWAERLCTALFDVAYAVAFKPEALEPATGALGIALCHVVEAPELGILVCEAPGQPGHRRRSELATELLKTARAAFLYCVWAFMAEEGTAAPVQE